ncbi:hypothetical protein [Planococcus shixiaomingii]|uniref:hypothetical protein n=1 Tax=Planococcus shixiaomingii TaxID=3058393 RepID=UPI00260B54E3|nr:hypothetical protein [Planococcus sp. N022]WKA56657.1 hypothetical protein QWY21_10010 [Planococcus sp. N022]
MNFKWGVLFGAFCIAVFFVAIKSFFEREKKEKLFSVNMIFEVLLLTLLFQIANWLFDE